jgi:hypothetical protein
MSTSCKNYESNISGRLCVGQGDYYNTKIIGGVQTAEPRKIPLKSLPRKVAFLVKLGS